MKRYEPKAKVSRPILYLDFQTLFRDETLTSLPVVLNLLFNSKQYKYFQTVNYCEIQREKGEVFVFKSLADTMKWLAEK